MNVDTGIGTRGKLRGRRHDERLTTMPRVPHNLFIDIPAQYSVLSVFFKSVLSAYHRFLVMLCILKAIILIHERSRSEDDLVRATHRLHGYRRM